MKRVACCLWLVLLMPSMALSFERKDGTYNCTVKFSGGIAYNNTLKQWEGAIFKPSGNFVMKLSFLETVKSTLGSLNNDSDKYDVHITDEGSSLAVPCLQEKGEDPGIDRNSQTWCETGVYEYRFNFNNHRFIRMFPGTYITGADENSDTPEISGGLCTKISE